MTADVMIRRDLQWHGRALLDGPAEVPGAAVREAVQRSVWNVALRLWASPSRIEGAPVTTPAVYVANHSSHADTAVLRAAFGTAQRRHLAVAAADDYFFSTAMRAMAFTLAVSAFPFPRHGDLGLQRANALLTEGWSVVLYPQGTRNAGSEFRPGALRLAREGWPIVPVGIAGTDRILPKGARLPRRAATAVVFDEVLQPGDLRGDGALRLFAERITAAAARAQDLAAG